MLWCCVDGIAKLKCGAFGILGIIFMSLFRWAAHTFRHMIKPKCTQHMVQHINLTGHFEIDCQNMNEEVSNFFVEATTSPPKR